MLVFDLELIQFSLLTSECCVGYIYALLQNAFFFFSSVPYIILS